MPDNSYDIRICESCGLRYPLVRGHPFGTRCPACMGNTRVVLQISQPSIAEPRPASRREMKNESRKSMAALLDNIRSAWNVGSILRSADGFGFRHVYLCGITPTGDNEAVTKTSLGAEDALPWSHHKDAVRLVKGLKAEGWAISALEEDQRSVPLSQSPTHPIIQSPNLPLTQSSNHPFTKSPNPLLAQSSTSSVLIVGNEVTGVDPELLDLCDNIFYIPMLGEKRSFNVAIAFSIAAYALSTNVEKTSEVG